VDRVLKKVGGGNSTESLISTSKSLKGVDKDKLINDDRVTFQKKVNKKKR
jgi:hypothetical protein